MVTYSSDKIFDLNVLSEEQTHQTIKKTLDVLSSVLATTLGPYGSNVLIENHPESYLSKDGHTVLSKIRFSGSLENTILSMIRKVSSRMNRSVGDGTTSSILISKLLYENIKRIQSKYTVRELNVAMENIVKMTTDVLKERAYSFKLCETDEQKEDFVFQVAKISANNNEFVARCVREAFRSVSYIGNIIVKESSSQETEVSLNYGYQLNYGLTSSVYINNPADVAYNIGGDINIFVSAVALGADSLDMLQKLIMESRSRSNIPVIFVAPIFDSYVQNFFEENKRRDPHLNYACVQIPSPDKGTFDKENFEDFCNFIGAVPYSGKENSYLFHEEAMEKYGTDYMLREHGNVESMILGLIKGEIKITENYTMLSGNNPYQEDALERIQKELEDKIKSYSESQLTNENVDEIIERLNVRKARLSSTGVATLYVGGMSDVERRTQAFLVTDAVCAVKSAIKYGLVPGCCLSTQAALQSVMKTRTLTQCEADSSLALSCAYESYYRTLCETAKNEELKGISINDTIICDSSILIMYNLLEGSDPITYELGSETLPPLPNSVETDINILNSSTGIMTLLACSSLFLATKAVGSTEDF